MDEMVECIDCRYKFVTTRDDELNECRRYPTPREVRESYWCGEGKRKESAKRTGTGLGIRTK